MAPLQTGLDDCSGLSRASIIDVLVIPWRTLHVIAPEMDNVPQTNSYPCRIHQNSLNIICVYDAQTQKTQKLPPSSACPPDPEQLCASDGRSYNSACQMQRTALQTERLLKVVHSGPCKKQEECQENCKFSAVCLLEHGRSRCSCEPIRCDSTYAPLCGNDGHTYPNDCERRRAECLSETAIRIKQQGPCGLLQDSPLIASSTFDLSYVDSDL
ncbi:agrin isoform X1 [Tachysurus ichikawai]